MASNATVDRDFLSSRWSMAIKGELDRPDFSISLFGLLTQIPKFRGFGCQKLGQKIEENEIDFVKIIYNGFFNPLREN